MFERDLYTDEQGNSIEGTEYADRLPYEDYSESPSSGINDAVVFKNNAEWNERMDREGAVTATGRSLRDYSRSSIPTRSTDNSNYWTIGKLPTPEYDTFTAPSRDQNRIGALRSRASGAGIRDLRRQTQQTIQGTSGMDATMRRMTLKDALQGYGSGVSKIMGQADRIAQSQYESEYGDKYKESMINYTTGISKANMEYQAELQKLARNAGLGANLNMNVLNYTK